MTEDTKRALDAIMPIAHELNIAVKADDRFLYCNGQAIGIGCNSTYATIVEFISYAMFWLTIREPRFRPLSLVTEKQIKRYWMD